MPCRTVYEYILYKYVIFIYYRNGAVIVILTIYVYSLKLYKNRNCENYDNILSLQFFKHIWARTTTNHTGYRIRETAKGAKRETNKPNGAKHTNGRRRRPPPTAGP